ncbi:MAG: hypothetical protein GMKNLPBB_00068 [Myxococcota bacterium]|nr:hypothetical protein [Myxococcota bacterium]
MNVFLTGATGYIGSYIAHGLWKTGAERLTLLVRAKSREEAARRLWGSMQLHMPFEEFHEFLNTRTDILRGDLTDRDFGAPAEDVKAAARRITSVIHCAASLNRKSNKACFNVNLRGTLEVLKLARAAADHHGLRRFSDISTVAVAGERQNECVSEDNTIDWNRSDYDPYARTKKFCEHMVHELLPDSPITIFRPATVLGDSRFPETTQFDMVRAFVFLASLPVLPFDENWRMDIVPADYVGRAIVTIHQQDKPAHGAYNLSAGEGSPAYRQIMDRMIEAGFERRPRFIPSSLPLFRRTVEGLSSSPRAWGVAPMASLLKVFLPYLSYNTVFDNQRVSRELGGSPRPFQDYAYPLFRFAREGGFKYPYKPWPEGVREFGGR